MMSKSQAMIFSLGALAIITLIILAYESMIALEVLFVAGLITILTADVIAGYRIENKYIRYVYHFAILACVLVFFAMSADKIVKIIISTFNGL